MADLEFKHNVQEIPRGETLPEPVKRSVGAEVTPTPDFQGTISRYAENSNWMSQIGSEVASKASTTLAAKLGGESGKNPHRDLGPSLTNFDKAFEESYKTQAESTLGIQAQTLISKTNLELAQMPRLDGQTIAKSQAQVAQGLSKIFDLAPSSIKPQMEHQYTGVMLSQNEQLVRRLTAQNKEDRQNNLDLSTKLSTQNIHSIAMSGVGLDKNGDSTPALSIIASQEKAWKSAVAMGDKTPLEAEVAISTARATYLSGKYSRLSDIAQSQGKLDQFLKSLADKPPADIQDKDHDAVYQNVLGHVNNQQALRSQNEQLLTQKMVNNIATDPLIISNADWMQYAGSVSSIQAEKTKFTWIQAMKSKKEESAGVSSLMGAWGSSTAQANASSDVQKKAFNGFVDSAMKSNSFLTRDDAEVQVAMSAGAEVKVFTATLHDKLWSGDPAQMDSAARQIHELQALKSGHALIGLNDKDRALVAMYEANRNPADPTKGAREVIDITQNQTQATRDMIANKWYEHERNNTYLNNKSKDEWILNKFVNEKHWYGDKVNVDSPFMGTLYAGDIYNKYHSYFDLTNGNENLATKLTSEYVEANYGETYINGSSQWANHPMEKTIGFASGQGIPSIYKDIARQLQEPIKNLKDAYDKHLANEYWNLELPKNKGFPIRMTQFKREGSEITHKTYDMVLIGSNFDSWEVNIQTNNGPQNIFKESPMLQVMTYTPDREWIKAEDMGKSHIFPTEKYGKMIQDLTTPKVKGE